MVVPGYRTDVPSGLGGMHCPMGEEGIVSGETGGLQETIELALRACGYLDLRELDVTVHGKDVVLRGRLPSYFLKQMAQTTVLRVQGISRLDNEIDVIRSSRNFHSLEK